MEYYKHSFSCIVITVPHTGTHFCNHFMMNQGFYSWSMIRAEGYPSDTRSFTTYHISEKDINIFKAKDKAFSTLYPFRDPGMGLITHLSNTPDGQSITNHLDKWNYLFESIEEDIAKGRNVAIINIHCPEEKRRQHLFDVMDKLGYDPLVDELYKYADDWLPQNKRQRKEFPPDILNRAEPRLKVIREKQEELLERIYD